LGNPAMAYLDYHRTVIGYHGTSAEIADALVDGEPFKESDSTNEWLGKGIYLDCSAFNFFYQKNEDDGEPKIDTARAAYVPTESQKRIWPDS
jgi:hypothetical protein